MADINVTLDYSTFELSGRSDPSGGSGTGCTMTVSPDSVTVHKGNAKTISFAVINVPEGFSVSVTDWRYKNGTSGKWYRPKNDPLGDWTNGAGTEFQWKTPSAGEFEVKDKATNVEEYEYVVEIDVDGTTYVNDPKIHNVI